jgi:hypothetical protein
MVPVNVVFSTLFPGFIEFSQIARNLATVLSMALDVVI